MMELTVGADIETAADYYAAVRHAELKPTTVRTAYTDPEGNVWHVDDPAPMTPAQRRESFAVLMYRRGLGPCPFNLQ